MFANQAPSRGFVGFAVFFSGEKCDRSGSSKFFPETQTRRIGFNFLSSDFFPGFSVNQPALSIFLFSFIHVYFLSSVAYVRGISENRGREGARDRREI